MHVFFLFKIKGKFPLKCVNFVFLIFIEGFHIHQAEQNISKQIVSATAKKMGDQILVTEIPSSLKQLARIVVRGFYTIEDALIVDMLVRNPCKPKSKPKQTEKTTLIGRRINRFRCGVATSKIQH